MPKISTYKPSPKIQRKVHESQGPSIRELTTFWDVLLPMIDFIWSEKKIEYTTGYILPLDRPPTIVDISRYINASDLNFSLFENG